ncbi:MULTISPECIES: calcineurin-like phosphoesterase C-terminal domain-containing protein [Niastella]|uniref:Calcineurin-like phosphoesterase C-terminal domain-containing protein n=1 Tax=Niastella soli TaxID=2821487 RepID=A0ABS3Z3J1_9BACT|nr:calcineurin-like phosphoesterase family protein [Niastella soli]MBO9204737.1 calcineurin-like phosphoesterase C-terminal domain-containing protein [Niastella soli]
MKRRRFLSSLGWLTAGWVLTPFSPAKAFIGADKKVKGAVLAKGKGLKNVIVSDGYSVVATDGSGKYEMELHPNAVAIFVSTPAGYAFNHEKGLSRHYKMVQDINPRKAINFELEALTTDDTTHQFIIWADPQVKNEKDVERMMAESVPDVQKFIKGANGALIHGITVGDMVWDNHDLFPSYNAAVEKMGIPFFQCIGNHDMDYNKGGDEMSDDTFQQHYGPTWYSFNRGKAHYVVMDDVRYLGKDREYDGYISEEQLTWLQKDLSFVPNDRLVIVCVHIPVHNEVKNNEALYAVLKGRNVHIMSGHTHYHRNVIQNDIFEHNHGTVCGAWWTGPICGDGTPSGYGVYSVKGTELSWYYQSTGKEADHQVSMHVQDQDATSKNLQVNVWNYDPAWTVECWVDGAKHHDFKQQKGFDALAVALYEGPQLPKPRGFAEPKKTDHLFNAMIPASAKQVKVIATDRFGKKYVSEYNA